MNNCLIGKIVKVRSLEGTWKVLYQYPQKDKAVRREIQGKYLCFSTSDKRTYAAAPEEFEAIMDAKHC